MVDINDVEDFYDSEHFLEIVDVDLFNTVFELKNGDIGSAMPLAVIQSKGVDVTKDFKVNVTDLNTDEHNNRYKHFTNTGDGGITFKVDVIIKKHESWGYGIETKGDYIFEGKTYPAKMYKTTWLNYWYTHMRPVYIVTDAIDVPNGTYILTNNSSRKQDFRDYTIWSLEFESYTPLQLWEWTASESVIKATTPAKTTTKSSSSKAKALKDCTANNIVYSKTKKVTECNKLMQEKLYKLGFLRKDQIDGWYGSVTMEAVKKFQKWYNKKGHNLLVDGICGAVTLKHLLKC